MLPGGSAVLGPPHAVEASGQDVPGSLDFSFRAVAGLFGRVAGLFGRDAARSGDSIKTPTED